MRVTRDALAVKYPVWMIGDSAYDIFDWHDHLLTAGVVPVPPYNPRNTDDPFDIEYGIEDGIENHSEDVQFKQSSLDRRTTTGHRLSERMMRAKIAASGRYAPEAASTHGRRCSLRCVSDLSSSSPTTNAVTIREARSLQYEKGSMTPSRLVSDTHERMDMGDGYTIVRPHQVSTEQFNTCETSIRKLTESLGCTEARINQVIIEPGEVTTPHTHEGQEEIFVAMTDGQIAIEGHVHDVPEGGIVRIHPDLVRNLLNQTEDTTHVWLAFGAPPVGTVDNFGAYVVADTVEGDIESVTHLPYSDLYECLIRSCGGLILFNGGDAESVPRPDSAALELNGSYKLEVIS